MTDICGKAMGATSQTIQRISARPFIYSAEETPQGVVTDATSFGARNAANVPLVVEARDREWDVPLGATVSSASSAAAGGTPSRWFRGRFSHDFAGTSG